MMGIELPSVLCAVFIATLPQSSESQLYLITVPKIIIPESYPRLTVDLLKDSPPRVNVTALIHSDGHLLLSAEDSFQRGILGMLVLPPISLVVTGHKVNLTVSGYTEGVLVFSESTQVDIAVKSFTTFIQTDKPLYKPGDEVKLRIISVNPDLKAYEGQINVTIKDPSSNIVQQWISEKGNLGVVSKTYRLTDNSLLGSWAIQVTINELSTTKEFTVAQYVLPKFEVMLDVPSIYSLSSMKNFSGRVHAKYTYGKPVKGTVNVTVYLQRQYFDPYPIMVNTFNITGSANFTFSYPDIYKEVPYETEHFLSLWINASVEESLTGITQTVNKSVNIINAEYNLEFIQKPTVLRPSLNFTTYLKISFYDGQPLSEEEIGRNVTFSISQSLFSNSWRAFQMTESVQIQNIQSEIPKNGIIKLEFPLDINITSLTIKANFSGAEQTLSVFNVLNSPSHSYLKLHVESLHIKVGTSFLLTVHSNFMIPQLRYLVLSKGNTILAGNSSATSFSLTATYSWAPVASVLVYYVRDDGEVVGDQVQISITNIFQNKVNLSWSNKHVQPSNAVSLQVNVTEPNSFVGILVVDKSAKLLGDANDLSEDMVAKDLALYGTNNQNSNFQENDRSFSVFETSNLKVMTDAMLPHDVITFPDLLSPFIDEVFHATDKNLPESPSTETKPIRSNFPETWIWNVTYTGASTTVNLDVVAPDTITSWIASAFVMSENLGLGLTSFSEELVVFQSFFISLNLPYSVIRGEELVLDVILFNYLNQSIEVMVTVTPSDDFQFVISLNDTTMLPNRQKVYIPSQEGAAAKFPVRPIKLGVIPITVHAAFSKSSDTVIEKILVKAEGIQQSFSQSILLSSAGGQQQNVIKVLNFTLPSDTVQDSASAFVTVVGDIMGPSISGLEYLIQMPCGCGEQNMIMFAPNIYVIQYLMNTKQVNQDIYNNAIRFMTQGYQGELRYQRVDGSFSAFGDSDSSGSTWLSAFVLKCFLQARPFIFIDPMVLEKTTAWLVKQQNFNGAFNEPGRVIHTELQGGHNGPITLTAYVLIALLENGEVKNVYKMEILSAVSYLENRYLEGISDNYTLSILTYALSLAKSHNASNALIELNRRADKRGGSMFWSSPPIGQAGWWQPRSSDIELAAYALLSHYTQVKITEGALVMKWLSQQRNHLGGYSSTQDTVIALQALSQFAANYSSSNTSLNVSVDIAGTEEPIMFRINSENLLVLQSQKIKTQNNMQLTVKAFGTGFAIFQVNIFFNIKSQVASRRRRDADLNEAFELDVNVFDSLGDIDHLHLNICTRFIENQYTNKTGMAMMEVGLLSGFMVDQDAIPTDNLIKKVEVDFQKVNIYLDSLNTLMICLKIPQRRMFSTASSQDATVVVYDYYEPGRKSTRTYNSEVMKKVKSCDLCGDSCDDCLSNVYVGRETPPYHDSDSLSGTAAVLPFNIAIYAFLCFIILCNAI
ncbi:CD109 antigen [Erpetoichthys calabaricus]|uniref:CD109 antigen n=1 Tax=Erpetoichthys calabaricus TaxID=27687 RepID=UPI0022346B9D|nr:CD109 antigen [Erpetoichthys calabaricus]